MENNNQTFATQNTFFLFFVFFDKQRKTQIRISKFTFGSTT